MAYDRHESLDVFQLRFEQFPGLTVRVRRASFVGLLAVAEAMPVLRRAARDEVAPTDLAVLRAWRKLCAALGGALVSWDLLNSGERVPANSRGLQAQDLEFIMVVAKAWQQATAQPARTATTPTAPVAEATAAPTAAPNPLAMSGLNPDGTDPDTGVDEEYLSQLPMRVGPAPLQAVS